MRRLGTAAIATAALLWAAGATVAGRLFARGASPVELTAARAWISVVGLGVFVSVLRRTRPRADATVSTAATVAFGVSLAAANFFYYAAIARLPVAVAIVIQYTAPAIVVVAASARARRAPGARVTGALVLVLAGVVLLAELPTAIARGALTLDGLGIAAAVGSAFAFASYILVGEGLGARLGAPRAMLRGFGVASVFWIVVLAARGRPDTLLDGSFVPGILFVGVGATIAPFLLFLWGLGHVGAARAGIISTLEPVAAALFAAALLGQRLGALQVVGGLMVIAGIAVVQIERPGPPEVVAEAAAAS